jgi:SNF2 family DNA or RNA helicase
MSLEVGKQEVDDISDTSGDPSRAASPDPNNDELPPVDDLKWAHDIFESLTPQERKELSFKTHSNKVRIVLEIVREAVALGENILVFVHSIPTLNYLQSKLERKKHKTYVLTGQTPMKDRQPSIDKFNKDTEAVYLISCRVTSFVIWC